MKKFFSIIFGLSLGITTMFNTSAQVLDIRKQDDPILREISTEVTSFDGQLETLIDDMSDTLIKNKAAGIAAPQVGKKLRIFLVEYDGEITEYVNPTITVRKGEQTCIEGCLSVTDVLLGEVIRPKYIKGKAFDKYGEEFEFEAEGDEACIICHEYDHLEGKLFTDFAIKTFTNKQIITNMAITIIGTIVLGLIIGHFTSSYIIAFFH